MPMTVLAWTLLAGGAMLAGAALVGLLSLRRSLDAVVAAAGLAGLVLSGLGLARLSEIYPTPGMTIVAVTLGFGCMVGGWGVASAILTDMATRTRTTSLDDESIATHDARITVALLTVVEPQRYDPSSVAFELKDWEGAGLPEPTIAVTPFLYAAHKARYRAVGGSSGALHQARAVADRLQDALDRERFDLVELVTCLGQDTLAAAVARSQKRGISKVITVPVDVAESFEANRARGDVEAMRPNEHGMEVLYAPPMWGSDPLAEMMADRIATFMIESQTTGAVLVMHGQPAARERTHPSYDIQENAFANRVRMLLGERGLPETSVRLCWAEWRAPDVTESVRHLAALGCTRILVSPVCFPFESITTVLDLALAVKTARVDQNVFVTTLQPWGDDPIVIGTLAAEIERVAGEFTHAHEE